MAYNTKNKYRMIDGDIAKEISHGICVSNLAHRVGKKMMLDDEMCYNLAVAGMLHDVGKLEMAKNIIKHNDRDVLRVEEMRFLRTHPTLGYALLLQKGYSAEIAGWVLYHHENYDGSGYPANKAGEEIPLGARILRVCDTFAALTTTRSYRKAYSVEQAIRFMAAEAKNFDLKVLLTLMDIVYHTEQDELLDHQDLTIEIKNRTGEAE